MSYNNDLAENVPFSAIFDRESAKKCGAGVKWRKTNVIFS